jgi:hypothetical protein
MPKGSTTLLEVVNARKAWDTHGPTKPNRPLSKEYVARNDTLIEGAVRVHALANDSDPFAASRIRLYILTGYEDHVDVYRLANSQLNLRSKQDHTEFSVALAPVKKDIEREIAWTQHAYQSDLKPKQRKAA